MEQAYRDGFAAGYAGETTLGEAIAGVVGTDRRTAFFRGFHAGVSAAWQDLALDTSIKRCQGCDHQDHQPQDGATMTEQDRKRHEVGVLHYLDPDYDGQGKSAREDEFHSMRALAIMLLLVGAGAGVVLATIVWIILR